MVFTIGEAIINIDENATREYYAAHPAREGACSCVYCRNYRAALPLIPDKVKAFFKSCGIDDMRDFVELTPFSSSGKDCLYSGWYHLVGSIEGGKAPETWLPPSAKARRILYKLFNREKYEAILRAEEAIGKERMSERLDISDDFSVRFSTGKDLKEKDFPKNCVQLEIDALIPWVIPEKPE